MIPRPTPIETLQKRLITVGNSIVNTQTFLDSTKAEIKQSEDYLIELRVETALLEKAIEVLQEKSNEN